MEYQITTTKTVQVSLSAETNVAITAFKKMLIAERLLHKREVELERWSSAVPDKDMEHYVAITQQLQQQFDDAQEVLDARRERNT